MTPTSAARPPLHILVTGAAGFIGFHVCQRLLARGDHVVGLDNLNDYYDVSLKEARLAQLRTAPNFTFVRQDIASKDAIEALFRTHRVDTIVHLAAQAGVRYSVQNPLAYVQANLVGFAHVLEGARHAKVKHCVFASTSSVYGANTRLPFEEGDHTDHPVSLYSATKKANEVMAHSYAHLYGVPMTGLRFFTVYGPWGRPDMALFKFTRAILAGEPIPVFNEGRMQRDFTYIDDIVEGVVRVIDQPATPNADWHGDTPDAGSSKAPYRLYNIGNSQPVALMAYIEALEAALGRKAILDLQPMQMGDVVATSANVARLEAAVGYRPATPIGEGVQRFVDWYRNFYKVGS